MADRFHAPTTAALELARSGMEITDAVVNVRARFDLTDADVVSVCARVDAALAAERKAVAGHKPGIVEAERPPASSSLSERGSAELHAALAPAAGTEERVAERLGLRSPTVSVELSQTPPEVLDAMNTLIEHEIGRYPVAPGEERSDTVMFTIEVSRSEVQRLREHHANNPVRSEHLAKLSFLTVVDRILWDTLTTIAAAQPGPLQSYASKVCDRVETLRNAQGLGREVLEEIPRGDDLMAIERKAHAVRDRVARAFEDVGFAARGPRIDLAIEVAHSMVQIADAVHHGERELARQHGDDLACVLASFMGSLASRGSR